MTKNPLEGCIDHVGTTLHRTIVCSTLSKCTWDNIAQNYLHNVDRGHKYILSQENRLFQICLAAWFLTGCNTIEQSCLVLFSVGFRVHLQLVGQQRTGADIDWNNGGKSRSRRMERIRRLIKYSLMLNWFYCIRKKIGNKSRVQSDLRFMRKIFALKLRISIFLRSYAWISSIQKAVKIFRKAGYAMRMSKNGMLK